MIIVSKSATATVVSGIASAKALGTPVRKQIDPAVRRAIQQTDSVPLTVLVKLDAKRSRFGRYSVTNRPGSARERTFSEEVAAEVENAASNGKFRILSTAANIGVATVEAPAGVVRDLLRSGKVAGMKLKAG